jgi:hypothetical protein
MRKIGIKLIFIFVSKMKYKEEESALLTVLQTKSYTQKNGSCIYKWPM